MASAYLMPQEPAGDLALEQSSEGCADLQARKAAVPVLQLLEDNPVVQVLSVFDRSTNLMTKSGDIISLVTPEIDLGPFAILVTADWVATPSLGQFLPVDRECLSVVKTKSGFQIGPLSVNTGLVEVWNPLLEQGMLRTDKTDICVDEIGALMDRRASQDSLWFALRRGADSMVAERMCSAWQMLKQAIVLEDPELCQNGAYLASGVGIGLTPAGDDFLLGFLLALWLAMPEPSPYMARVIAGVAGRTGRLSEAWLNAAVRGEASEAWHHLAQALARNDKHLIEKCVSGLLGFGHTSGADALTGFIMTMELLR